MTTESLHGMFVHGIGQQTAGFSSKAQARLSAGLEGRRALYGQEVLWAPVLDADERLMMKTAQRRGSSMRMIPRLTIGTLADALTFPNRLEEIHDVFDRAFIRLRAPGPVSIFAHSLGVVLALKWLEARPRVEVERFVTFGTNLELWHLGAQSRFVAPAQVRAPGVWQNAWDEDDALGWAISHFTPARDTEVSVGGLFTGTWGIAHNAFWGDRTFWKKTVPGLLT